MQILRLIDPDIFPDSKFGHAIGRSLSGHFFCRCLEKIQEHGVENIPTFFTTKEIQQLMRCSRSTVNNRIRHDPDFPKPGKFGRNLLWPAAAFNVWLAKRYGVQS